MHTHALSPDAKHFIYQASDYRQRRGLKTAWTTISQPPYLTAIALYPTVSGGGGLFLDNTYFDVFAAWVNGDEIAPAGNLERVFKGESHPNNMLGYVKSNGSRVLLSREDHEFWLAGAKEQDVMRDYHVEEGRLFRRHQNEDGTVREFDLIRDFTDMKFEEIRAPYVTPPAKLSNTVKGRQK